MRITIREGLYSPAAYYYYCYYIIVVINIKEHKKAYKIPTSFTYDIGVQHYYNYMRDTRATDDTTS